MKLDAVGFVVGDLDEAAAFYRELGLVFAEGEGHREAGGPGGLRIMIDSRELIEGMIEGWTPRPGNTMSMAFLADSPDEVDIKCRQLTAMGAAVVMEPWDAFWGQRYACLKDPWGNAFDIFAPLPS
jgi:catechol 2,3-dioxygenase-like lactoylglutathione lyase family enzyme